MASVITLFVPSGRLGYAQVARDVRTLGLRRSPRGQLTYDLGPTTVVYETPYDALPVGVGRNLNVAIGAAEAVQLIAGRARHDLMPRISPTFTEFQEVNGKFWGAYGERIGTQMHSVIEKLQQDRHTRQAVVTLWKPGLDNTPGKKDYPCTVALNFCITEDRLEMRTLMRSNDVWWGLPYDVFQFTQLQLTVSHALNIAPGRYTHTTWSLHLYDRHTELVDALTEPTASFVNEHDPSGFGGTRDGRARSWNQTTLRAVHILNNEGAAIPSITESELWYERTLAPYVG